MKICGRCKTEKDKTLFPKRAKGKDGLSAWCTACHTANSKERYAASAEERSRKARNQNNLIGRSKEYVYQYLLTHPCGVCGENDPIVLEFDHRDPSEKEANVSELFKYSLTKVKQEIEKCDVLCANCHRRKTVKQFDTWKNNWV